jgi:hypothetical protein
LAGQLLKEFPKARAFAADERHVTGADLAEIQNIWFWIAHINV